MPRIPRLLNSEEPTIYHVMSRTTLDGFPLGDVEKDYLLKLIQRLSQFYFVDILGFSIMGNHFHLLTKVHPESGFSDEEIKERVDSFYDEKRNLADKEVIKYRNKLENLSEFVREIKQSFTRYYNKKKKRFGFFWGQRFKSVIVERGETLLNCLAYIDLNPIRANLCEKPEEYRWNSLGYLLQTDNESDFLSLEFGLYGEEKLNLSQRISKYRRFVYEVGSLSTEKGRSISKELVKQEEGKGFQITKLDRFRHKTRYFTDSGIIGSKKFVSAGCLRFQDYFNSKKLKKPTPIKGLGDCFSLKRLALNGS